MQSAFIEKATNIIGRTAPGDLVLGAVSRVISGAGFKEPVI